MRSRFEYEKRPPNSLTSANFYPVKESEVWGREIKAALKIMKILNMADHSDKTLRDLLPIWISKILKISLFV